MNEDSATPPTQPQPEDRPSGKPRGHVAINTERCKGCGFCVEFCPTATLEMSGKFNSKGYHYPVCAHPEKCTGCDMCGMYCPDFAICGEKLSRKIKAAKE